MQTAADTKNVNLEETGLYQIKDIFENPFSLFGKWFSERLAVNIGTNSLCLSTATKNGRVSARSVVLRRLDEDGLVIMTDNRSKKVKELKENPYAAMTFLWVTDHDGVLKSRQVRAEGLMRELPLNDWNDIYEQEPLFCKIRAYVCHQGVKVKWEELKQNHDTILKQFIDGKHDLERPNHVCAYKMEPSMMEFYETEGQKIADRLMYLKEGDDKWNLTRIAA